MNKFILLSSVAFLISGLATSCSDDENIVIDHPDDVQTVTNDFSQMFSARIIEIDENTPKTIDWILPHKYDLSVEVTERNGGKDPFNFRIEKDEDGFRHLICDNLDLSELDLSRPKIYNLNLSLADGSKSKDAAIILRAAAPEVSTDDEWYFADQAIGWGMDITDDFTLKNARVIAFSTLDRNQQTGDITVNTQGTGQDGECFESGGQRYEDLRQSFSMNIGLKGQKRVKNGMLSGSINGGVNSQKEYSENYEYYVAAIRMEMATAALSKKLLLDPEELRAHMVQEVCEALNDPSSLMYKFFPNDDAGIKLLYETYGTHVVTRGTFGGLYTIKYSRMETIHSHDIGVDLSASIKFSAKNPEKDSVSGNTSAQNKGLNSFFSALTNKMTSSYLSGDADMSYGENSYQQAIHAKRQIHASGNGGSLDLDTWSAGLDTDRSRWVLTRFETPSGINTDDESNLIPLYDFVFDKDSERYNKMKEYYDKYVEEKCPKPIKRELVLADFMMKAGDEGGHGQGTPKPFGALASFNNNQHLLYIPIYMNHNGPYPDQKTYALDTMQDKFAKVDGNRPHYWYVAYGFLNTMPKDSVPNGVEGLIDIRIGKKSEFGEDMTDTGGENLKWYSIRGDAATTSTISAMNENYIWVHAKPKTDEGDNTPIITAIGLCRDKSESEIWSDVIYASTYGSEWKTNFESFYPSWSKWWDSDFTKCSDIKEGFYEQGAIKTDVDVHVVFSTDPTLLNPLDKNLCWGETLGADGLPVPNDRNKLTVFQLFNPWDDTSK